MGDITDLFSTISKTKVTPTKVYNAAFNTNSTVFVDVTGLSIVVPNNAFYVIRGSLREDTGVSTVGTLQVLQGSNVVFTDTITSGGGGGSVSKTTDSLILQNTSGASQTVKVQLKTQATGIAYISTMSIIQAFFILTFDSQNYAVREGWQDISSLDFVSCFGDGSSVVYFDGVHINDSTNIAVTWNTLEKFCNTIRFYGNNIGYVGFDFSGKYLVL